MRRRELDAVILVDPASVLYISGYWTILSAMAPEACVVGLESVDLVIPALEQAVVPGLPIPVAVSAYRNYGLREGPIESPARPFAEALLAAPALAGARSIGAEFESLRAPVAALLRERPRTALRDIGPLIRDARAEKDHLELGLLRRAADITARAVAAVRHRVLPGVTEVSLAAHVSGEVGASGGVATHVVIGSGPRSALAHPEPSEKRLAPGDLVLIDVGVLYRGYWAEVARTYVVGGASSLQQERHRAVEEAQRAAVDRVAPGVRGGVVDAAARSVLQARGFDGLQFNHSAGHGLGVLGMDKPVIAPGSHDLIPTNGALTLEPALYFPGEGGIRIEDTLLITDGCVENLTGGVPRALGSSTGVSAYDDREVST
jgi:Xaa-Pro aminopeptidase